MPINLILNRLRQEDSRSEPRQLSEFKSNIFNLVRSGLQNIDWDYRLGVEYLPSMCEALDLIPSLSHSHTQILTCVFLFVLKLQ